MNLWELPYDQILALGLEDRIVHEKQNQGDWFGKSYAEQILDIWISGYLDVWISGCLYIDILHIDIETSIYI